MSDLRQAAQQALEALTPFVRGSWTPGLAVQAAAAMDRLKAALAEPAQEPGCRDDGMPTSAEERHLRRLLARRATMPHAYYDDGEAQGIEHGISIDFMREPVAHIDAKLRALNVARAIAKQSEPVAWLTPGQDLHLNNGEGFRFSDWTPLYTAPPQRKPLTDEQKQAIHNETGAGHSLICLVESYINGIKE